MQTRNILAPRVTIPRRQTTVREKRPVESIKVVNVRGVPITLKWVESLQCWCEDPNSLLKARREKAKVAEGSGSPWRLPPARIQTRKPARKRAMRA